MFERFTDDARKVVVSAQEEARELDHNYIGTEHFLLGLLHDPESVAGRVLGGLDVELEIVRSRVVEIVGRGHEEPSPSIPFTPRAKKVLELSLRESRRLRHNYIGTEHILLGVVREGRGVAAQLLGELTGGLDRVREATLELLESTDDHVQGRLRAGPLRGPGAEELATVMSVLTAIERRLTAIEARLDALEDFPDAQEQ